MGRKKKNVLGKIYYNLAELNTEAKDKNICTSLAVFKPTEILNFIAEPVEREWDKDKLAKLQQLNLFENAGTEGKFEVVKKLPYKFSYKLTDNTGKESRMMIEDWEIGQLYWKCLAKHEGDEVKALNDVKKKYFDDFAKTKDLHLFLGTTLSNHYVSLNSFIIIGTFHPLLETQGRLF